MAAEATDIVSLNEIKSELRIGGDTDEERVALDGQDAMLTNQLKAAVSFIQEHTTLPLINRTQALSRNSRRQRFCALFARTSC